MLLLQPTTCCFSTTFFWMEAYLSYVLLLFSECYILLKFSMKKINMEPKNLVIKVCVNEKFPMKNMKMTFLYLEWYLTSLV